ncbi:uncharacterized protein CEXT_426841 [Caerostris extrusa]|uniref:Uncharacterized protein n=1 Tax=Caerostris extrusa TaxID=172846 RepID=A0AAV4XMA2_CAEEX|nr:uncharacterized protein CEXT_426841 [Caerostris extrusa]
MKHWGSALSFFKRGGRRRRSSYAHPGMRYELVNRRVRSARNDLSGNREADTPLYVYVQSPLCTYALLHHHVKFTIHSCIITFTLLCNICTYILTFCIKPS